MELSELLNKIIEKIDLVHEAKEKASKNYEEALARTNDAKNLLERASENYADCIRICNDAEDIFNKAVALESEYMKIYLLMVDKQDS